MSRALILSLASLLLLLPAAASAARAKADPARTVCVPARDSAGKPVGRQVCRTEAQWAAILRANLPTPDFVPFQLAVPRGR